MSINERIQRLLDDFENGNQKAFSERLGVAPSSLNGIVGARQSDPSSKILNRILDVYANVNAEWLLSGKGNMTGSDKPYKETEPPIDIVSDPKSKEPSVGCWLCAEKDKVIAAQKAQIETQAEYIELLKVSSSLDIGQKRKLL